MSGSGSHEVRIGVENGGRLRLVTAEEATSVAGSAPLLVDVVADAARTPGDVGHTPLADLAPVSGDDDPAIARLRWLRESDGRLDSEPLEFQVRGRTVVIVRSDDALSSEIEGLQTSGSDAPLDADAILQALLGPLLGRFGDLVDRVEDELESVERAVWEGGTSRSRDIYRLARSSSEIERALSPLPAFLDALEAPSPRLQQLQHRAERLLARVERAHDLVTQVFSVNGALIAERQNTQMAEMTRTQITQGEITKKISAWAAVFFAPTIIAGIYGMNFRLMPELHWVLGYPFALGLMVLGCAALWAVFKRADWI